MAASIAEIFTELSIGTKLRDFYSQAICSGEYRYVMIVPRKCMTEYKCLCKEDTDLKFKEGVYYMTPKSFIQYRAQIVDEINREEDFSILIIDDIMMYGRGINNVLLDMVKNMSPDMEQKMIDRINISVFIASNKNFLINEKFSSIMEERFNYYILYHEFKNVLRASDLFLESFYAKLVPNTSFVSAWYYKNRERGCNDIKQLCKNNSDRKDNRLFCYIIKNKAEQDKYKFSSVVYHEKQQQWMERWAEFWCVRSYCNGEGHSPFLIPYVFLKPMTGEQIDSLLGEFQVVTGIPQLWEGQTDDLYILKYEYLTRLISDCYGVIFMKQYLERFNEKKLSWGAVYAEDDIASEFTFGRHNLLPIEMLCEKLGNDPVRRIQDICMKFSDDDIQVFDEEFDSGKLLEKAVDETEFEQSNECENKKCASILNVFLKLSNLQDEKLAEEGRDRCYGLSTIRIRNIFLEKHKLKSQKAFQLYGEMIRCMDTGTAAISIKKLTNGGKVYYGAVMNSGEQAYRELQEKNAVAIQYMARIEQDCRNLGMASQTEGMIDDFWKEVERTKYNIGIPISDINGVRNVIRDRNGKYSDMDIKRSVSRETELLDEICMKAYRQIKY